jgi:hypothetical protein
MARAPRSSLPRSLNASGARKVHLGLTSGQAGAEAVEDAWSYTGARSPEDIHFIEWVSLTTLST